MGIHMRYKTGFLCPEFAFIEQLGHAHQQTIQPDKMIWLAQQQS